MHSNSKANLRGRNLTFRYILALGLMAFVSLLAYFTLHIVIQTHESSASVVNVSGRQRMLSQRTALFSQQLVISQDPVQRQSLRDNLMQATNLMETSHKALIEGNPALGLPGKLSPKLQTIYFSEPLNLDRQVRTYISKLKALAAMPDAALSQDSPDLKYILTAGPGELLTTLDLAVSQYEFESKQDIANLQSVETLALYMALLILGLEAFFIFRPMVRRIQKDFENLNASQLKLEENQIQLRANQTFMEQVLDALPVQLYIKDRTGTLLLVNQTALTVLARPKEAVIGHPYTDFFDNTGGLTFDTGATPALVPDNITGGQKTIQREQTFRITTGPTETQHELTALSLLTTLSDTPWGEVVVDALVDITERKQLEEQLRKSEELYRTLASNFPDAAILLFDHDLRYIVVEGSALAKNGYNQKTMEGKTLWEVTSPDRSAIVAPYYQAALAGKESSFEDLTPSGLIYWIKSLPIKNPLGEVIAGLVVAQDITARKRVEKALEEERDFAVQVMNTMGQGLSVINLDLRFEFVNLAYHQILGYDERAMLGKHVHEMLFIEDWAHIAKIGADWKNGQSIQFETRLKKADGQAVYVLLSITPRWQGGKITGAIGVVTDLTERKRAEEALQESEARFRQLAETIDEVYWLTESATNQLVYVSPKYQTLTGLSCESFYADTDSILKAIHPQDFQRVVAKLPTQAMGSYEDEFRMVRPDGEVYWVRVRAFPIYNEQDVVYRIAGVCEDITQRKASEEALQHSASTNRALLNAIPDVMLRIDETGTLVNFKAEREFGLPWPFREAVGQTVLSIFSENAPLANLFMRNVKETFATGQIQIFEYQLELNSGVDEYEARCVISGSKEVMILLRDITERKKVERLKNEFVSTVSHELRTPLTSIRGSLGLVLGGVAGELPGQARAMTEIAYKNCERLVRLINDILDIEKIESGKLKFDMRPLEISEVIEQTLEVNRAYGQEFGVKFELVQVAENLKVQGDSDRLTQVLTNLLSNAAKFSPKDSLVEVKVERKPGGFLRVSVKDHGPGIPLEFQSQIFQKFAQADSSATRQKGGTGLGLSIARAIVESHGGQIGFETELGIGTSFYFDLPLWEQSQPLIDTTSLTASQPRILICEDDPDVGKVLSVMLQEAGYTTDIAYDSQQARRMLDERSYELMTLDLKLPGQDGLTLLKELRQQTSFAFLPVIVISIKVAEARQEMQNRDLAVAEWLEKPIDQPRLVKAVKQAIGTLAV